MSINFRGGKNRIYNDWGMKEIQVLRCYCQIKKLLMFNGKQGAELYYEEILYGCKFKFYGHSNSKFN